jgi:hypothetical protein
MVDTDEASPELVRRAMASCIEDCGFGDLPRHLLFQQLVRAGFTVHEVEAHLDTIIAGRAG